MAIQYAVRDVAADGTPGAEEEAAAVPVAFYLPLDNNAAMSWDGDIVVHRMPASSPPPVYEPPPRPVEGYRRRSSWVE
jgi:hypothetical protein